MKFLDLVARYVALTGRHQEGVDRFFEGTLDYEDLPKPARLFVDLTKKFQDQRLRSGGK